MKKSKIANSMSAAAIDRFGGPQVLRIHKLPVRAPSPNEVLIALNTAGVGSWDAEMRGGWNPFGRAKFPMVLGVDGSGIVAAVGSRIRRLKRGDRVYSFSWDSVPKGGFYAEYVAVPGERVARKPKNLDLRHAGAMAVTGLTALQGVDDTLHLKKGETVIIHGASGGVGNLAVQFAKWRGARVFATASADDGVRLVRRLGADEVVNGRRSDIAKAARAFAPDGVDALLAFAGGKPLTRCLDALRRGGRVAYPNGVSPAPRKRKGIRMKAYDGVAGVREFERLTRAVEKSKLYVPIAAVYALTEAARAHQHIESGHVIGKVVLRIR